MDATGTIPLLRLLLTECAETSYVRHVRAARPLHVEVDGITSRGVIYKQTGE